MCLESVSGNTGKVGEGSSNRPFFIIICHSGKVSAITRPSLISFAGYAMISLALGVASFSSLNFVQRGFRASRISFGKLRFTPNPLPLTYGRSI